MPDENEHTNWGKVRDMTVDALGWVGTGCDPAQIPGSINALGEPSRGQVIAEAHRLRDTILDKSGSGSSEDAAA